MSGSSFDRVLRGEVSAVEALGLSARDADKLLSFAVLQLERNDLETAEASAEVATACAPGSFDAWMVLGSVRARRKEAGKALEAYARAAEINPKNARLWCDIGEIKLSLLDYNGAARAFALALDADPHAKTPGGKRAQALIAKTAAKMSEK